MSSDIFAVVCHIEDEIIKTMLYNLEEVGVYPIEERRMALLYQIMIPIEKNQVLTQYMEPMM